MQEIAYLLDDAKEISMKIVGLIPARSGSKRVPDKNIIKLDGHPLLAYSVRAAIDSGVFDKVICVTDSDLYANIARYYGAEVPSLRPESISGDKSPDIEWVQWILSELHAVGQVFDAFSILRPTSPFRLPQTIKKAWRMFLDNKSADSLRAVEKCSQHPGKMWVAQEGRLLPLLPFTNGETPWHSSQYAALPEIYVQNASLEIAWSRVAVEKNSIAGVSIIPFISEGHEGFDINQPEDIMLAKHFVQKKIAQLPLINCDAYSESL